MYLSSAGEIHCRRLKNNDDAADEDDDADDDDDDADDDKLSFGPSRLYLARTTGAAVTSNIHMGC